MDSAPAEHDEAAASEVPQPVDPDAEVEPVAPDDPAERRDRRVPALVGALAILVVVAIGTSWLAATATAERNRERKDRRAVEEVAGRLATALSTYDHRDFEATKRRVLALSTGAFSSEYERAVGALSALIDQTKATSEAAAVDVFVGNLEKGKASAIVVLEIRGSGIGGPRVSVDNYVDLSLVKVEGQWRVDGVRNLNLGVAGGGTAAPPTARPPSPAPAPAAAP